MKKIAKISLLGLVAAALIVPSVWACPKGGDKRGGNGGDKFKKMFHELDLKKEQKEEIKSLMKNSRAEIMPLYQARMEAQMRVNEAVHTGDEAAIREANRNLAAAQEKLFLQRGKVLASVRSKLTPEQIRKMEEKNLKMREKMKEKMGKMHERWQGDGQEGEDMEE